MDFKIKQGCLLFTNKIRTFYGERRLTNNVHPRYIYFSQVILQYVTLSTDDPWTVVWTRQQSYSRRAAEWTTVQHVTRGWEWVRWMVRSCACARGRRHSHIGDALISLISTNTLTRLLMSPIPSGPVSKTSTAWRWPSWFFLYNVPLCFTTT